MEGMTYGGKIVDTQSDTNNKANKIEANSNNPNYLAQVANKKPQTLWDKVKGSIGDFIKGAYSWPFDFDLCIAWLAGCMGLLGSAQQSKCLAIGDKIAGILGFAATTDGYLMFRVIYDILTNSATAREKALDIGANAIDNNSATIAGRVASGSFFITWMKSGGRWGKRMSPAGVGGSAVVISSAFIIASFGSFVHVALKHSTLDWHQLAMSWLTGNPDGGLNNEKYEKLFEEIEKIKKELNANGVHMQDYMTYRQVIEKLIKLGKSHHV